MPVKTITAPGSTVGVNILKSGTDYDTVHDATAGTNAGNEDNKFTIHGKSGSNYLIRRGILLYDFANAVNSGAIRQNIRVVKAQLILNDITENAAQTGGDKIRIGWIEDPNTFGSTHANDYDKTRYSSAYTSAQQLDNGADGEIIEIDRRFLLDRIQEAINRKTWLHLVIRNELDYQDTTATGNNRTFFDRPNADDNPLQLKVFYRILNSRHNYGGAGTGRASTAGFGGSSVFAGTNSGFSLQ